MTANHFCSVSNSPRAALLWLPLLLVICFCLATDLNGWFQSRQNGQDSSGSFLDTALGETRRMFASQFFTEADVYFHSGYYPTIFDNQTAFHTPHMALYTGTEDLEKNDREAAKHKPLLNTVNLNDEDGSPGAARNWIDEFSRNFYPVRHTHLNEVGKPGEVAEILPWLKLCVELDPHQVDAYVVASYWLRQPALHKSAEAETFLREGLRANPDSCEILFELGRIQWQDKHDADRARNLWETGLRKWETVESRQPEPNKIIHSQLLAQLAKLEEQQGNYASALQYLARLKTVSPSPDSIQAWIEKVKGEAIQGILPVISDPATAILQTTDIPTDHREFQAQGVVKEINWTDRELTIAHGEITNYMPAMTMPFSIKDTNELAGLKTGDAISFHLILQTNQDEWIEQIKKISPTKN